VIKQLYVHMGVHARACIFTIQKIYALTWVFSYIFQVFVESCSNLLPNVLCEYLYNLSEIFTKKFYSSCQVSKVIKFSCISLNALPIPICCALIECLLQVVGSPEETSRLLLCEATLIVMRHCFYLLGIDPVYKLWSIISMRSSRASFLEQTFTFSAQKCRNF